jgi:hypothetical protein
MPKQISNIVLDIEELTIAKGDLISRLCSRYSVSNNQDMHSVSDDCRLLYDAGPKVL